MAAALSGRCGNDDDDGHEEDDEEGGAGEGGGAEGGLPDATLDAVLADRGGGEAGARNLGEGVARGVTGTRRRSGGAEQPALRSASTTSSPRVNWKTLSLLLYADSLFISLSLSLCP